MTTEGAKSLPLGWIPYWNLLPLRKELLRHWGHQLVLSSGHPTAVNRQLADGRVMMAPSSSICLVTNPGNELALPLGISSSGPVQSVYLAIREPHGFEGVLQAEIAQRDSILAELFHAALQRYSDDLRGVAHWMMEQIREIWNEFNRPQMPRTQFPALRLTSASATSAAMARILYQAWFGVDASRAILLGHESDGDPDALGRPILELIIGDEALMKRCHFSKVIDLGETWFRLTGLPFVFAVWQRNSGISPSPAFTMWRQRVWEVSEIAQARMKVDPTHYLSEGPMLDEAGHEIDMASYWRCLEYRLGPSQIRGLVLFLSLANEVLDLPRQDTCLARLMRWQEWASDHALSH